MLRTCCRLACPNLPLLPPSLTSWMSTLSPSPTNTSTALWTPSDWKAMPNLRRLCRKWVECWRREGHWWCCLMGSHLLASWLTSTCSMCMSTCCRQKGCSTTEPSTNSSSLAPTWPSKTNSPSRTTLSTLTSSTSNETILTYISNQCMSL